MFAIAAIVILLLAFALWFFEHSTTRSVQKFNMVLWTFAIQAFLGSWVIYTEATERTPFYTSLSDQTSNRPTELLAVDSNFVWTYNDSAIYQLTLPEGEISATYPVEVPIRNVRALEHQNGAIYVHYQSDSTQAIVEIKEKNLTSHEIEVANYALVAGNDETPPSLVLRKDSLLFQSAFGKNLTSHETVISGKVDTNVFSTWCICNDQLLMLTDEKALELHQLPVSADHSGPLPAELNPLPEYAYSLCAGQKTYPKKWNSWLGYDGKHDFTFPTVPVAIDSNGQQVVKHHFFRLRERSVAPVIHWEVPEMKQIFGNECVAPLSNGSLQILSRQPEAGDWVTALVLQNAAGQSTDTAWLEHFQQLPPVETANEIIVFSKMLDGSARYDKQTMQRMDGNSPVRNVTRRLEARYQKAVPEKVGLIIGLFGLPLIGLMFLMGKWIPAVRKAVFLKKLGLIYFCITTLAMLRLAATLWDLS